jgi:hypothetical protein
MNIIELKTDKISLSDIKLTRIYLNLRTSRIKKKKELFKKKIVDSINESAEN